MAITTIKQGILILSGIIFLSADTTPLLMISTKVTATPIANEFVKLFVIASVEQSPISWMNTGLFLKAPSKNTLDNFILILLIHSLKLRRKP